MVLHHVAQRADAVIIGNPAFKAHRLAHGDLHMVDMARIPQRLEQHVAEAQRDQILHRLLAEIMIDAVNPVFGKQRADHLVHLD